MIQIPIFPRDEFFEIAIGIAKIAKNKDDFKRIFEEKNQERLAELEAFLSDGSSRSLYNTNFPCHDAYAKTMAACCDPYFSNLMSLLKGCAFGWEADEEPHEKITDVAYVDSDGEYHDPWMETQYLAYSDEEYSGAMEPDEYIPDENFTLPKATNKAPPSSTQAKRKRAQFDDDSIGPNGQQHQEAETSASNPVSQDSPSVSQAANESTTKSSGVDERRQKRRRLESSPAQASSPQSSAEPRKSEKRSRRDENEDLSRKRQRLDSPVIQAPTSYTSSPEEATRSQVSKKRSRHDDEYGHPPKRQKLETSATQTPISDAPSPALSATEQRKGAKRRSRHDDSNISRHRRQKRQSSAASDAASPHTAGQPIPNDTSAVGSGPQKKGNQRGSQKRKAAANTSRTRSPPSRSTVTRSSRRNGSATLWELDDSGKAKLR